MAASSLVQPEHVLLSPKHSPQSSKSELLPLQTPQSSYSPIQSSSKSQIPSSSMSLHSKIIQSPDSKGITPPSESENIEKTSHQSFKEA